jgi:hypothetical protein
MTAKTIHTLLVAAGIYVALGACTQKDAVKKPEHTFSVKGSVREMTIWPETVEFPEHEGKTEFTAYCGVCHSLRYITVQPDFPRKVWEAEVTKMVVKYKAPIDSATSKKIVEYLVAIKSPH